MYVQIHFGEICNFRCSYCINGNFRVPDDKYTCMSVDVLAAAIEKLNRMDNITTVGLYGGEPTVYPHIMTAVSELRAGRITLLTNGLLCDKFAEIVNVDRKFSIDVTVHDEYWRAHREEYAKALLVDYDVLCANRQHVNFSMKLLIDLNDMDATADIADWLTAHVDMHDVSVYHVRRTETQEEFVKAYIAAKRRLPEVFYRKLVHTTREMAVGNPFYDKPCEQFVNYLIIDANGYVHSNLCKQAITSRQLITDPAFSLTPCKITCNQKVIGCFDNCMYCHGLEFEEKDNVLDACGKARWDF